MADSKQSSPGFNLPTPNNQAAAAPQTSAQQGLQSINLSFPGPGSGTSSRDMLIGGSVLLVLVIAFFFAKGAYATSLVGRRVEPRSANAAGWWLFIFLTLLSVGVVLAVVSGSALMTPLIVGPLSLGAIVALVLMLLTSRR